MSITCLIQFYKKFRIFNFLRTLVYYCADDIFFLDLSPLVDATLLLLTEKAACQQVEDESDDDDDVDLQ